MNREEEQKEPEMKVLSLTPFERIVVINLLPKQASRHKGMLIQQIKDTLSLTDEEIMSYNVNYLQNGDVVFGKNGQVDTETSPVYNKSKKFEFPQQKLNVISSSFKKADKEERLPVDKKIHELFDKVITE